MPQPEMTEEQKTCLHPVFEASVDVVRLNDAGAKSETATNYMADIKIHCMKCKVPFSFLGLKGGFSYSEPRSSIDGFEIRAPIAPGPQPFITGSITYDLKGGPGGTKKT